MLGRIGQGWVGTIGIVVRDNANNGMIRMLISWQAVE